jgi:hypothetical protein
MRLVIVFVCALLTVQPAFPQQGALRITIVQGSGARNVVQQIAPRRLAVRVADSSNRPVPGAAVTFTAPDAGPTGEFENESRTFTTTTDDDGVATAQAYHPNSIRGPYSIHVRSEFQDQMGTALIAQTNIEQGGGGRKIFAILGIGAAAVGAAILAARKDKPSEPNTPPPPTITFGGSAVGAPTPANP